MRNTKQSEITLVTKSLNQITRRFHHGKKTKLRKVEYTRQRETFVDDIYLVVVWKRRLCSFKCYLFKAWNKRDITLAWFHDFFQVVLKKKRSWFKIWKKSQSNIKNYISFNQKLGKVTVISVPLYGVPFVCISRAK